MVEFCTAKLGDILMQKGDIYIRTMTIQDHKGLFSNAINAYGLPVHFQNNELVHIAGNLRELSES